MSIDFKANRIRGYAIIASGTLPDSPAFLIYGSGSATDFAGTVPGNLLSNVGSDTFLFVSGAIGQKNTKYSKSTTVFGGDVVISGTLYNGAGTAYSTGGGGGSGSRCFQAIKPAPQSKVPAPPYSTAGTTISVVLLLAKCTVSGSC